MRCHHLGGGEIVKIIGIFAGRVYLGDKHLVGGCKRRPEIISSVRVREKVCGCQTAQMRRFRDSVARAAARVAWISVG